MWMIYPAIDLGIALALVGDVGLKVSLENQIADETRHKEELERVLAGWDER